MVAIVLFILLVVLALIAVYLNFQVRINPNHAFIVELINRFLK